MKSYSPFILIAVIIICFLGWRTVEQKRLYQKISKAKNETQLQKLEEWIGDPMYIYKKYPPSLGADILTEEEFDDGVRINAYLLRSFHPLFLIVKYEAETKKIILIKTENS